MVADRGVAVRGQSDGGGESNGHESGRKIVEILGKNKSDYTEGDIDHMRRIVSYVHRHQAQKPNSDVENSNWRYSLLNWGHDPMKYPPIGGNTNRRFASPPHWPRGRSSSW